MPAVRITVICDECIRIEWSPAGVDDAGVFVDEPSLLVPVRPLPRRVMIADAAAGAPPIDVRTSRVLLQFRPDGEPLGAANFAAHFQVASASGRMRSFWHPGDRSERNLGGTIETLDGVRGPIPLGEGLLSRDGWHLIDDSAGQLLVDGWVAARAWRGVPGTSTDWYLFAYGHDYGAALRAFTRLCGAIPAPRRAAMGSWYSRYWPHTSAEFRGIVADYHQHGIPLDTMVLDMDWHSGSTRDEWTGWSWNRELLPDAEELLSWMHAHGLQVALNLHPADGVGPQEDRYAAFMRAQGADPQTGERLAFDAGNRPYMTALFGEVLVPLEERVRNDVATVWGDPSARMFGPGPDGETIKQADTGVDFWWVDWQQDRYVASIPGLTNLAWLNRLFFAHSSREGRRGISLSRWAGIGFGDHRHPVHFSGDAHTGWEMLAFQVPFTIVAGNAACFFWSHDIGGHFGPRIEECTARWCWFGSLSAAMRLHSARSAALDRRPWTYTEPFASAMRAAFALRSRLMPVIDAAAHECEDKSLPLLRPMYLAHPELERAYRMHHQYTIGEDLLAVPITTAGVGPRCIAAASVWFPPTSAWFNWFTHERYERGTEAYVAAAVDEVPLFAAAGVPVLTRTFSHCPAIEPIDHLVIRLYPGEPGSVHTRELYEDDGDTLGYRRGELRKAPVRVVWGEGGRVSVTVGAGVGAFAGAIKERAISLEIGGVKAVGDITVNGRQEDAVRDEEAGLWRISAGTFPVAAPIVIDARLEQRTAAEYASHAAERREERAAALGEMQEHAEPTSQSMVLASKYGIGAWPETSAAGGVGVWERGRPDSVRICDPFASMDHGTLRAELIERIGLAASPVTERVLSAHSLELGRELAASIPLPDEAIAQPPTGLRCSRIARFTFSIGGNTIVRDALAETRGTPITSFVIRGPYPWDWRKPIQEQVFEPEQSLPEAHGLEGWASAHQGDQWPVDFRRSFPGQKGVGYAAAVILSERSQRTTLHLDSGDRIEAWLNGAKVFSLDGQDSPEALTSEVELQLPAGRSVLLIKTNDGGGGWGFAATLEGESAVRVVTPPELSNGHE